MAAGCCTVVKLPEATPHFSALFEKLMAECVDTDFVRIAQGAVPETTKASIPTFPYSRQRTDSIALFPASRVAMGPQ